MKFKQPASRFALVGVFVSQGPQGVRVAVTGAGPCVFRASALEAALAKDWSAKALEGLAVPAEGLNTDLHASAAYRAHLVGVLVRRAVARPRDTVSPYATPHVPLYELLVYGPTRRLESVARVDRHDAPDPEKPPATPAVFLCPHRAQEPKP